MSPLGCMRPFGTLKCYSYFLLFASGPQVVEAYLPTLPGFVGVSRKSAHKRGGAYENLDQKWAFLTFPGVGLKSPGLGGKKVGKYGLKKPQHLGR